MSDTLKIANVWNTLANFGSGVNLILNVLDPEGLITSTLNNYITVVIPKGHTLEVAGSAPIIQTGVSNGFQFSYTTPGQFSITTSGTSYAVNLLQAASYLLGVTVTNNNDTVNLRCLCMDSSSTTIRPAVTGLQDVVRRYVDAISQDITVQIPYSLTQPYGTQTPGTYTGMGANSMVNVAELLLSLYPSNY